MIDIPIMKSKANDDIELSNPYQMFCYSIRTELTRKYYERRIRKFLDFIEFDLNNKSIENRLNSFAEYAKTKNNWVLSNVIRFLQFEKDRVSKNEISPATLKNFVKSLKSFFESADISLPWNKITKGLPKARMAANDRSPTTEEIKKLLEYPDRRIKPIVYTMTSCGMRLGAWDYLRWKHITPFHDENGNVLAAKIVIYAGDPEEYFSFITPESYISLKEWMDFRAEYGEKITENSWVMRDIWQTTNITYGAKWGLATSPKKLKSSAVKRILERGLLAQGLRKSLLQGEKRHEWKAAHGFRKFYKTRLNK